MYVNSKSLFIWVFEATILKGCFMMFTNVSPTFLELLSYSGYKFVPLCLIVSAQIILGYMASYCTLLFTGLLFMFFFYKTMSRFGSNKTLAEHIKEVSLSRQSFLMLTCISQILIIWVLSAN